MMRNQSKDHHLYIDASKGMLPEPGGGPSVLLASEHQPVVKELLPVVVACIVWGKLWQGKSVLVHCNNQAVVDVVELLYILS